MVSGPWRDHTGSVTLETIYMRIIKLLIFVLTMLAGTAQLARHVYVRWIEHRESVLHRYEQDVETRIRGAESLKSLEHQYAIELKRARQEASAIAAQKRKKDPDYDPETAAYFDPKVQKLEAAINDWERKSNEIREIWYFWFVGFLVLLVGAWAFRRGSEWPGVALYLLAFLEMIWWTSPSFVGGAEREFARLLDQKILFTVLALALLLAAWRWGSLKPSATHGEG